MTETPTSPTPTKNPAAQALGRLGGAANTPAQNKARRKNAQHAGRPGRVCNHCGDAVVGGHVDRARDATCGQHGWHWRQSGTDTGRATGATATLAEIAVVARRRSLDVTERLQQIHDLLRAAGL